MCDTPRPDSDCSPPIKRLRSMTVVAETFEVPDLPISPLHAALIEKNAPAMDEADAIPAPYIETFPSSVDKSSSQIGSNGSAFPVSPLPPFVHSQQLDKLAYHFRSHGVFESDIAKFVKTCSDIEFRNTKLRLFYCKDSPPSIQWFTTIFFSFSLTEKNGDVTSGIFKLYMGKILDYDD
jgi:hypothetical protein